MISTYLMYPWPCIREEFFIPVSEFLMPSPRQLRTFLAIPKKLKLR
jgi:hypothetical protein